MTDRELEQRLADAMARTAPDDLGSILSRCGERNGSVMELEHQNIVGLDTIGTKPRKRPGRWLAAACAALALLGAGGGGLTYYHQNWAVASVVSLDVNPSIELKVNRAERVISCTALNDDAAAVLFSMGGGADLKGTKVDVAVNAIVGALVKAGYMQSISSAILISVEDHDQDRAARIQQELVASVDGVLQSQAPGASVLSQVITQEPAAEHRAFDSGISAGKAALVRKVMEMNGTIATDSTTAFDALAALSVEELNDLLETRAQQIPIGKPAAALAAETYAGTLELDSVTTDVDPELDESPAHYEVELTTAWGEFEYIVDAWTGEVLRGQKDVLSLASVPGWGAQTPGNAPGTSGSQTPGDVPGPAPTPQPPAPSTQPSAQDVGREAAIQAALDHAGSSASEIAGLKVEREWDDGRLEYEVEFWCGTTEYDYTIDGYSCAVLKYESEQHPGGGDASADIGQEAAKAAALAHAGVTESQITKLKVEMDWDDGRLEYEVEFDVGSVEYEYTIDGATGAVLEYEQDWD